METKIKILDGVVESTDTDNLNEVTLIYTKLNFERFVDKSNKLCRGYKQHLIDLEGSVNNTKQKMVQHENDSVDETNKVKAMFRSHFTNQIKNEKIKLDILNKYCIYVRTLIPKLEKLCDTLETHQYVDESKKDSPRAKIKLTIDKHFAKDIHNNLKTPEVHIATDTNGEYIGLVGYVSY